MRGRRSAALAEELKVGGLTKVAHDVLRQAQQRPAVPQWSQRDVIERALALFGLASAQNAADVLTAEGVTASN